MKTIIIALTVLLFASLNCYAGDSWYEAAEASAVDYNVSVSREIPAGDSQDVAVISREEIEYHSDILALEATAAVSPDNEATASAAILDDGGNPEVPIP